MISAYTIEKNTATPAGYHWGTYYVEARYLIRESDGAAILVREDGRYPRITDPALSQTIADEFARILEANAY